MVSFWGPRGSEMGGGDSSSSSASALPAAWKKLQVDLSCLLPSTIFIYLFILKLERVGHSRCCARHDRERARDADGAQRRADRCRVRAVAGRGRVHRDHVQAAGDGQRRHRTRLAHQRRVHEDGRGKGTRPRQGPGL